MAADMRVPPLIGLGWRRPLAAWLDSTPPQVECLELTAEHFFDGGAERLQRLRGQYPLYLHGLGLSLGTPGPLDPQVLAQFCEVARLAQPQWISEHIAFTRTAEVDLGHLNPLATTEENLALMIKHARELSERCQRPLILENITSHLKLPGMPECEFLTRLCEGADCGLLLDVTNLWINAQNHGFDPLEWLRGLPPQRIVQLHIVGYSSHQDAAGRTVYDDNHAVDVQPELLELLSAVCAYAPVQAVILERDDAIPQPAGLIGELAKLRESTVAGCAALGVSG
ncbi:DUF692 domain-containing protein [bacterium]|nr:DUF692 domain-containing protein [bacterium]